MQPTETKITFRMLRDATKARRWDHQKDGAQSSLNATLAILKLGGLERCVRDLKTPEVACIVSDWRMDHLAEATINRRLSALSALLSTARDYHDLPKIKLPFTAERGARKSFLSREDAEAIAKELESGELDCRSAALMRFLLATGMRLGEALGLRWGDVRQDPDDALCCLLHLRDTKNAKDRLVPCRWKLVLPFAPDSDTVAAPHPSRALEPVFKTGSRDFQRKFKAAAQKVLGSRMPADLVPHSLRHTCASWMVASGVPLHVVKDFLGHSSLATTTRYAHNDTAALKAAAIKAGL